MTRPRPAGGLSLMTERTADETADAPRETGTHRHRGFGLSGKLDDETIEERAVTSHNCWLQRELDTQMTALDLWRERVVRVPSQGTEVGGFAGDCRGVAARKDQETVDHPFASLSGLPHGLGHGAEVVRG